MPYALYNSGEFPSDSEDERLDCDSDSDSDFDPDVAVDSRFSVEQEQDGAASLECEDVAGDEGDDLLPS